MKQIVDYLNTKNIICKKLREIKPKVFGSRKKINIFIGINLKGYYCSIITIEKKSRILRKEVGDIILLHDRLEDLEGTKIFKRYIRIKAPLCSHAKIMFQENGWIVWD